jgi:hypothetical protein
MYKKRKKEREEKQREVRGREVVSERGEGR